MPPARARALYDPQTRIRGKGMENATRQAASPQRVARAEHGRAADAAAAKQALDFDALTPASPQAAQQAQLAGLLHGSPAMLTQRRSVAGIQQSPAMGAQRKRLHSLFGAQFQGAPIQAKFFGDEAAQGDQLSKPAFLDQLRAAIQTAADQELAAIGQSSDDCPYLAKWFAHYQDKDASYIQRAIERYAPASADASTVDAYVQSVVARVTQGLREHVATGSTEAVPAELVEETHAPEDFVHIANEQTAQLASLCNAGDEEAGKKPAPAVNYEEIYSTAVVISKNYPNVRRFEDAAQTPKIIKECSALERGFFQKMSGNPHFPIYSEGGGTYAIIEFIGAYPNPAPNAYPGDVAARLQQAADICSAMARQGISHNDMDNNLLLRNGNLVVIDFGASRAESEATALHSNRSFIERFLTDEQKIIFRKLQ